MTFYFRKENFSEKSLKKLFFSKKNVIKKIDEVFFLQKRTFFSEGTFLGGFIFLENNFFSQGTFF